MKFPPCLGPCRLQFLVCCDSAPHGKGTWLPTSLGCKSRQLFRSRRWVELGPAGRSQRAGQVFRQKCSPTPCGVFSPWWNVMPEDSLPLLPLTPYLVVQKRFFWIDFFFLLISHSPWTISKFSRHLSSDPKAEADTFTHSKKSLFHIYMYSKPLEFFFHKLTFFSSPSFSNVLRNPACGYVLITNATDIKQPH